jgi:hypothetical protein
LAGGVELLHPPSASAVERVSAATMVV